MPVCRELPIAVFGATGHTARFVLDELSRRGWRTVLVARDPGRLAEVARRYASSSARQATIDDAASLDAAFAGTAAVINCAGPFLDTALPVVDAALRARIPYLDVTAEQGAVIAAATRDGRARRAGVTVVPAAAFFGGLADLLATSLSDGATVIDEIGVAVALDRWHPTAGTRATGARNTARRFVVRDGRFLPIDEAEPERRWAFPEPFGERAVAMVPLSETIALARHLPATRIDSWIDLEALRDVGNAATPGPEAVDERGRSSQTFVMDVRVRIGERRLRATASGRDIYAVSAPIVVEALQGVLASNGSAAGVRSLGEIADAGAVLRELVRCDAVSVTYERSELPQTV